MMSHAEERQLQRIPIGPFFDERREDRGRVKAFVPAWIR